MTGRLGDGIARITWTGTGCVSALTPVTVTVNAIPAAPSANNPSICAGQTATINASANANWYTVPAGGASIGQAQNYTTPSLNNNVTYYMEGVNGPCVSATRTPVTVTVNASPASNAGASIVNTSTCGKDMVNIGGNALAAGQTGQWTVVSAQNNAGGFQGLFANGGVQANDQFTGTYGGTYVLKWAVTNSANGCIGEDTMVVTFHQPVDASLAGLIGQGDVLWCGLTGSDGGTTHAVTVCGEVLFDSNTKIALKLNRENLNWSCGAEGVSVEYVNVHLGYRFEFNKTIPKHFRNV